MLHPYYYITKITQGTGVNWHGHVTAVTVGPDFRRQKLAQLLMQLLEDITEKVHNGYFVDLFVRCSNKTAQTMYNKFGYTVYRRVLGECWQGAALSLSPIRGSIGHSTNATSNFEKDNQSKGSPLRPFIL
jgi:predicted acetyltransferase